MHIHKFYNRFIAKFFNIFYQKEKVSLCHATSYWSGIKIKTFILIKNY